MMPKVRYGFLLTVLTVVGQIPAHASLYQVAFSVSTLDAALQSAQPDYAKSAYFAVFVQPQFTGYTFGTISSPNSGQHGTGAYSAYDLSWVASAQQNSSGAPTNTACGGGTDCWAGFYKDSSYTPYNVSDGTANQPYIAVISGANGGPSLPADCGADTNIFTCYTDSTNYLGSGFQYESTSPSPLGFYGIVNPGNHDLYTGNGGDPVNGYCCGQIITNLMPDTDTFSFTISTNQVLGGTITLNGNASALVSDFTNYADNGTKDDGGLTFTVTGNITPLGAAPEPGTWTMLAGGGLMIALGLRRRRTVPPSDQNQG